MTLKVLKEPVSLQSINYLFDHYVWSNTFLVILLSKLLEDAVNRDLHLKSSTVQNERSLPESLKSNDLQISKLSHLTQVTQNLSLNNEMKSKNSILNFFESLSKSLSKRRCPTNPIKRPSQELTNLSLEVRFQKKTHSKWKKTIF